MTKGWTKDREPKRWLRAFPRVWRDRYGCELDALVDDLREEGDLRPSDRIDIVRSGLAMRPHRENRRTVALTKALFEEARYRRRRRWQFGDRAFVLVLAALLLVGLGWSAAHHGGISTVVGTGIRAQTTPSGVSSQAITQVSAMCTSASQQVQTRTASGFMQWLNQKCNSGGAGTLAASANNNAAPMGALICRYAATQVEQGGASTMTKEQVKLCNQKPAPGESGMLSQPNSPPSVSQ